MLAAQQGGLVMGRITRSYWIGSVVVGVFAGCASSGPPPAAATPNTEVSKPAPPPPAAPPEPPAPAAPAITPVDPATAPQPQAITVTPADKAIVAAKDRSAEDKALDAGRHPGELLTFFGVKPGMKVAEIFAGGGYTTELLARAVGKKGTVYGQNNKAILEKFAEKPWSERLKKPVMKNVVRVDRELDDPLPPEAKNLDIVFSVLVYHDTVWIGTDRDKMNAAIFAALKPGGVYAIVDHSGRTNSGETEVQTLHRIEEPALIAEVEKAGFKLAEQANFLRNPQDPRDWNDSPTQAGDKRGTSDRFAIRFKKP
jgi:predicted methyltransferase